MKDLLPAAAALRRGVAQALSGEFARWGYRAVITPLYEYEHVLARGLGSTSKSMRFVEPSTGEILALRPDLTPQVARLVATRLHDQPGPLRLFYEGSVVRNAEELYQAGVELIDAPQAGGDLESVALACAALRAAGIGEFTLDLGHAAVAHEALTQLGLGEDDEGALYDALAKKDAARVAELAQGTARRELITALPSLYGGREVLSRARALLADATPLDELERLLDGLSLEEPSLSVSLDLGEVRGFRYYTGTRFAVYAAGSGRALAQGGRYDRVVERYGRPARATGFAVDVDALTAMLDAPPPADGILVAGPGAAQFARKLRARGAVALLDLDEPSRDELRKRAARLGLSRVAWVGEGDESAALDALAPPGSKG